MYALKTTYLIKKMLLALTLSLAVATLWVVLFGSSDLSKVLYRGGFGGRFLVGAVFGLVAASKTAPLKQHPKNRTPKNAQKY